MLCIYSVMGRGRMLMREDHSVMQVNDEAKQDRTPRATLLNMGRSVGKWCYESSKNEV